MSARSIADESYDGSPMRSNAALGIAAFLLMLGPATRAGIWAQKPRPGGAIVPATVPDTIATWVFADSNVVADSVQTAAAFYANVISVRFRPGAVQADRQAAIDAVGGTVVGGAPYPAGEGKYYVWIDAKRRIEPLRAAARMLRKMPQVAVAVPVY